MTASFFSSPRERRLWVSALVVVLAIYSTLGVVPTLSGALRSPALLGAVFVAGMLLVGATVLTQGLKVRPHGAEIGVALGIAAAYLMVFVRMQIPEERTHLIEYSVVAVFIYEALVERARRGRRVRTPFWSAIVATSLIGVLDECIQGVLDVRVFALRDILFNVLAALMATTGMATLRRVRR